MRLRGIREVTGITPEALAETTGVTVQDVMHFESGETEIPVSYLYEVAKACSVDLTALLTGDEAHLQAYSLVRSGNGLSVDRRKAYKYQALAYRFHKPAMRDQAYGARVRAVNEAAREACAKVPGCTYMEASDTFVDAAGKYVQAKDINGKKVSLRAKDGVHMTMNGYDLLCRQVIDRLAKAGELPAQAK